MAARRVGFCPGSQAVTDGRRVVLLRGFLLTVRISYLSTRRRAGKFESVQFGGLLSFVPRRLAEIAGRIWFQHDEFARLESRALWERAGRYDYCGRVRRQCDQR